MVIQQLRKKLQKLYQTRHNKKLQKMQFTKTVYTPHLVQVRLNIKSLQQQKKTTCN